MYEALCAVCKKGFRLGTMGIKAVESHLESANHKAVAKTHQQTPDIYRHCSVSSTSVPKSSTPFQIPALETAAPPNTLLKRYKEKMCELKKKKNKARDNSHVYMQPNTTVMISLIAKSY